MNKLALILSKLIEELVKTVETSTATFLNQMKVKLTQLQNKMQLSAKDIKYLHKLKSEIAALIPNNNTFESLLDEFNQSNNKDNDQSKEIQQIIYVFSDALAQQDQLFYREINDYLHAQEALKTYQPDQVITGELARVFTNYKMNIGTKARLFIFLANHYLADSKLLVTLLAKSTYEILHELLLAPAIEIDNYYKKDSFLDLFKKDNQLNRVLKTAYLFYLVSLFQQQFELLNSDDKDLGSYIVSIGGILHAVIIHIINEGVFEVFVQEQQAKQLLKFVIENLDTKSFEGMLHLSKHDRRKTIYEVLIEWSSSGKKDALKCLTDMANDYTYKEPFKDLLIREFLKFLQKTIFTTEFVLTNKIQATAFELMKKNPEDSKDIINKVKIFFKPNVTQKNTIPDVLKPVLDSLQKGLKNKTFTLTMNELPDIFEAIINKAEASADPNLLTYQMLFDATNIYKKTYDDLLTVMIEEKDKSQTVSNTNLNFNK